MLNWLNGVEYNKPAYMFFVEIKNAFDRVISKNIKFRKVLKSWKNSSFQIQILATRIPSSLLLQQHHPHIVSVLPSLSVLAFSPWDLSNCYSRRTRDEVYLPHNSTHTTYYFSLQQISLNPLWPWEANWCGKSNLCVLMGIIYP